VYHEGTRRSIDPSACERCSYFEYDSPFFLPSARRLTTTNAQERGATARSRPSRAEKRLEIGVRVVTLVLAVVFAGTGFVALTRPLAIPLTIGLWFGALTCFVLGIWGSFNRPSRPSVQGDRV
jgi:hypothetical protein